MRTVIQELASRIDAYKRCRALAVKKINYESEWKIKHREAIRDIVENQLPSGSGIDNGCAVDIDASAPSCIVITTSFHHMNEGGYYDGWTDHTIKVYPSFDGIELKISGRNRNDIKDYLAEIFNYALLVPVVETVHVEVKT